MNEIVITLHLSEVIIIALGSMIVGMVIGLRNVRK